LADIDYELANPAGFTGLGIGLNLNTFLLAILQHYRNLALSMVGLHYTHCGRYQSWNSGGQRNDQIDDIAAAFH